MAGGRWGVCCVTDPSLQKVRPPQRVRLHQLALWCELALDLRVQQRRVVRLAHVDLGGGRLGAQHPPDTVERAARAPRAKEVIQRRLAHRLDNLGTRGRLVHPCVGLRECEAGAGTRRGRGASGTSDANWSALNHPCFAASSRHLISIPVPLCAGLVSTTLAPRKRISLRRSMEKDSAMTQTKGYPLAAQTIASPMPVLPDVASTTVCPGSIRPCASAHSIMPSASLSFTDPIGLNCSHLTNTFTPGGAMRFSLTMGVAPTVPRMEPCSSAGARALTAEAAAATLADIWKKCEPYYLTGRGSRRSSGSAGGLHGSEVEKLLNQGMTGLPPSLAKKSVIGQLARP